MSAYQTFRWVEFAERHARQASIHPIVDELGLGRLGPWLVGGAVRRAVDGQSQDSDFDLAFASAAQLEDTRAALDSCGFREHAETDFHIEMRRIDDGKVLRVQLLKVAYSDDPWGILDTFDYTICQFAFDGESIVCGPYSLWDLGRKRLAIHRVTYATSSVRRMLKYARQGFHVCGGCITSLLNAVVADPKIINGEVVYLD